ncbi:CoA transferase [Acrocarpospora macrocephala]|uniref:CoA transferase n=1 Tax=Acrocarpospora macrocephala TaxID=150177 RepID=A0A5M3X541_9ACTN|nr:CoA transferase [Acrocarpospora macrocephala]GES14761.1 CoA transferase [Acrocarpospora macrocephala]
MSPAHEPLDGLHVLEISVTPAAAYAGLLARQLGARVTRLDGPLLADCAPENLDGFTASIHRGKIIREPAGLLQESFDVVITDAAQHSACDRRVREFAALIASRQPDTTILVDIDTGGADGAAITASAAAGMSWAIGNPGMAPLTLPLDLPYYHVGTEAAAMALLGLLLARRSGTRGQRWSLSPTDVLTYYAGQIASNFLPYERPWARDGARASMSGGSYPAAMFECSDGWVSVMCRTDSDWVGLLEAMGNPSWSRDEKFQDPREVARLHADEADVHLKAWFATLTRDEAFALSDRHRFPMAPVLSLRDSMNLPQFEHRGFFVTGADGRREPGPPWRIRVPREAAAEGARVALESWSPSPAAPLAGLRVLDLSWAWSGPMVTAGLADLGADVIKVENRGRPDPTRVRGPAIRNGATVPGPPLEATPYYNQVNHAKKSIAVDFTTAEGAALIRDLAARVDVVVENLRPGVLGRRGLAYEDLARRNPRLVMLSMSLLGQDGPMSGLGGYAPVMSGLAGLDSMVGYSADDLVGLFNPALGDPNGADHALVSLLGALLRLEETGEGCHVDLSQTEALVALERVGVAAVEGGAELAVPGNGHRAFWPYGTWRCAGEDEWLALTARTDTERGDLAGFLGLSGEPGPAEFAAALDETCALSEGAQLEVKLAALGIPVAAVRTFEQVQSDPRARITPVPHRYLGEQLVLSVPWRLGEMRFPARSPGPLLGEHTLLVLRTVLGMTDDAIAALSRSGAIEITHESSRPADPQ